MHEEHEGTQQDTRARAFTRRVSESPASLTFKYLSFFVYFFVTFVTFVCFVGECCFQVNWPGRSGDTSHACATWRSSDQRASGNKPGSQRHASLAGKAIRSGALELAKAMTPRSASAATTRLAVRSLVPSSSGTSPRGSSPR